MKTYTAPRKKARHPIFPYLIRNMTKYDYSKCSKPQENETLNQAIQCMKKERVKWTPTRKATYRYQLIQCWNARQSNPLMQYHKSWLVRDMYLDKTECKAVKLE